MNINEGKLQDILSRRKSHIKSHATIVEASFAFLSYIVSILLSGVLSADTKMKVAVGIITIAYIVVFYLSIRGSKYSVQELYNDIVSAADIHAFSLLVIKDSHGRFLLKKNNRWKTFLLPFSHTKENEDSASILNFTKETIGVPAPSIQKQLETDITKHSVSSNMSKTYHHTFYQISFDEKALPQKKTFRVNGEKYRWYSIEDMKADHDMMLKNKETIDFIEKNF